MLTSDITKARHQTGCQKVETDLTYVSKVESHKFYTYTNIGVCLLAVKVDRHGGVIIVLMLFFPPNNVTLLTPLPIF